MRLVARRTGTGKLAALIAALVFALHSALALATPPVERDIFGNVICTDGSSGRSSDRTGGGHVPDCCLFACNMAASIAHGPPPDIVLPTRADTDAPFSFKRPETVRPLDRRTHSNPRAPPLSI